MPKTNRPEATEYNSYEAPDYVPLSADALAELARGIESAKTEPIVYLGSFAQYAADEE